MVEQCYWPQTVDRWHAEGLPEDTSPERYFELDALVQLGLDRSLRLPNELIEETDEWLIDRDSNGVAHKRWKRNYGPPAEVDHLIKTRADWERYRDRLEFAEERIPDAVRQAITAAAEAGRFCCLLPGEPVWWMLTTLGMETGLTALALEPEFVVDIMDRVAALAYQMMERLLAEGYRPDAVLYSSDLCYRNGMLFSPATYRRHMMHYHRQMADLCHAHDMFLIHHCDGDVRQYLPLLIEAGFDCIEPLEARAGNDVRELKPLHGDRISFFGNIDMDILATNDRDLVRHEVVSKVECAKVGGGYIHQSDHSVPPTVRFDTYRYAMELAREHGGYA